VEGEVYTWGRNREGQLGVPNVSSSQTPIRVPNLNIDDRSNTSQDANILEKFVPVESIYCGPSAVAAVRGARFWVWGTIGSERGKLYNQEPVEQKFFDHNGNVVVVDKILSISLALSHIAVVTQVTKEINSPNAYVIFTLGDNEHKQLGHKKTKSKWISQLRPMYFKNHQTGDNDYCTRYRIAACGPDYTLTACDSQMMVWGYFVDQKIHKGHLFLLAEDISAKIRQVCCESSFVLLLTEQGRVYAFGDNSKGLLGIGAKVSKHDVPTRVNFVRQEKEFTIKEIASSSAHCLAIDELGFVWSWGKFENGRLGYTFEDVSANLAPSIAMAPKTVTLHSNFDIQFVPARIEKLSNRYCIQIAARHDHNMVLCKRRLFGEALEVLSQMEGRPIPKILEKLFSQIESQENSLPEGPFRIPGNINTITKTRLALDRGEPIDLSVLDVVDAAALLKLFFIEMPEPLFTLKLKNEWNATKRLKRDEEKIVRYKELLMEMPSSHRATLLRLLSVLRLISDHHKETRMTSEALAMTIAPVLTRALNPVASITAFV